MTKAETEEVSDLILFRTCAQQYETYHQTPPYTGPQCLSTLEIKFLTHGALWPFNTSCKSRRWELEGRPNPSLELASFSQEQVVYVSSGDWGYPHWTRSPLISSQKLRGCPARCHQQSFSRKRRLHLSQKLLAFVVKKILMGFLKTPWWVCRKHMDNSSEHTERPE